MVNPVITFQDSSATAGGLTRALAGFSIFMRDNTIPMARVIIDPKHTPGSSTAEASEFTLADVGDIEGALLKAAAERSEASLKIGSVGAGGLTLDGWVCTGAGIRQASAQGAILVEIEMQHPLAKADASSVSTDGGVVEAFPGYGFKKGSDVLSTLLAAAEDYAELEPVGGPAKVVVKEMQDDLKKAVKEVNKNLTWKGASYPLLTDLDQVTGNAKNIIQTDIAKYIPGAGNSSLWGLISETITHDFIVTAVPTELGSSPLELRPHEPWQSPSINIEADEIESISFPAGEGALVGGVLVSIPPLGWSAFANGKDGGSDHTNRLTSSGFVSAGAKSGAARIVNLGVPSWFASFASASGGVEKEGAPDNPLTGTPGTVRERVPKTNSGSKYSKQTKAYATAAKKFAQAAFYTMCRQTSQISIQMRLNLDKDLVPGKCAKVMSENGGTVVECYISEVIHLANKAEGTAQTQVIGRYVRPSGGFPGFVSSGEENPMYK